MSLLCALVVMYRNLQVERGWVCSALHYISHQVNVLILGMLPGALGNNAASQGEAVHALQLILHFLDRPRRADEGSWQSRVVLEVLHVLLSNGCCDEPTQPSQRSDESAQRSQPQSQGVTTASLIANIFSYLSFLGSSCAWLAA